MSLRQARRAASEDLHHWNSGLLNPSQAFAPARALTSKDGFLNCDGAAAWGRGKLLILQRKKQKLVGTQPAVPSLGVLALRFDMKEGKVAYLDQGIQRWRKQEEAQHWNAAQTPLVHFWPPLWMGHGLEARRFGFYPDVTHRGTIKTSLNHFYYSPDSDRSQDLDATDINPTSRDLQVPIVQPTCEIPPSWQIQPQSDSNLRRGWALQGHPKATGGSYC